MVLQLSFANSKIWASVVTGLSFQILSSCSTFQPLETKELEIALSPAIVFSDVYIEGGPVGKVCRAASSANSSALIFIGGSGGGLSFAEPAAALACQEGYTALALAYWRYEGLPTALELVPLEYFDRSIEWLAKEPDVDASSIGLVGYSRGGEAALLVASRNASVAAVAALVPGSHVGASIDFRDFFDLESAWSIDGEPVPFVTTRPNRPGANWQEVLSELPPPSPAQAIKDFENLLTLPGADNAVIPVETIAAPILLVGAGEDAVWASSSMVDFISERISENGGMFEVQTLQFDGAGHDFMVEALDSDDTNSEADEAWRALLAFFARHL
ncbi:MAG: acyl-CoA thioester hydrolase/BAAT C-terminal domain-containing protein [Pseudomonadota bacterium]